MERTVRAPRQLPLFSTTDLELRDDPVGAALGIDDDFDGVWRVVMDQFARMSVKAYYEFRAGSDKFFCWEMVVDTSPDYFPTPRPYWEP